jgi:PAS domain S-box-containing protein
VTSPELLNAWFPEPVSFTERVEGFLSALGTAERLGWVGIAESNSMGGTPNWRWAFTASKTPKIGDLQEALAALPLNAGVAMLRSQTNGDLEPDTAWGINLTPSAPTVTDTFTHRFVLVTNHEPRRALVEELVPRLTRVLLTAFGATPSPGHQDQRDMLAAMPDAVVVLCEQLIHFANDAFVTLCGSALDDVRGANMKTFVHPEDWAQFESSMDRQGVFSVRFQRSDKSVRVVEVSGAGVVAFEGNPSRIFVARDVTENLLSREQYVRDDRLAAIGSLAVGVAHEVNNPLAYVMLNLEILQSEVSTRLGQEAISEALDGVRRIRRIVSELGGFWHGESRAGVSVVDIETVVSAATSLMQNEIRHRATLLRRLEPDLCVVAREGYLVQVLVNILIYAVNAIPDNSGEQHTILVGSRSVGESGAEITISDNGRGFAPEELSRMFDPFGVPGVPSDKTGLGLAITKRMVDELGGHIAVTSNGHRGSTFSVILPRAQRSETSVESRRVHPDLLQAPFRVLVVDDEPLIVRAIKRVLTHCNVQTAVDGGEALALLAQDPNYDVVLCDLMMPRVSGPELFRQVSARHSHLLPAFVFMTGGAFSEWSRRFLQSTECPVITKPFEPTELRDCVERTAVGVRRLRSVSG